MNQCVVDLQLEIKSLAARESYPGTRRSVPARNLGRKTKKRTKKKNQFNQFDRNVENLSLNSLKVEKYKHQ